MPALKTPFAFRRALVRWYLQHGRSHLPWQQGAGAYAVWLSEIMLQQTQVETVIPYFERFVHRFPHVEALAAAPLDEVLHLWTGLGYYSRARHLHRCAQQVVQQYAGQMPSDLNALMALPGIGRSTAGAIRSLAFGLPAAILDGNVKRVLARYFAIDGWPGLPAVAQTLWQQAEGLIRSRPVRHWGNRVHTQVLMDLGASLCKRSQPLCQDCPLQFGCKAFAQNAQSLYPSPKPRKTLPSKPLHLLVVQNPMGEVLLQLRPAKGLWGGLWSLPEAPIGSAVKTLAETLPSVQRVLQTSPLPAFKHTFSHYHLLAQPVALQVELTAAPLAQGDWLWYNLAQPAQVGLPAPVKRLLHQLGNRPPPSQ